MSYVNRPDAVHTSTSSKSPSRQDVEANGINRSLSDDSITKHHTSDRHDIPMRDFGARKQMQTEVSENGSNIDAGENYQSTIREPTNIVQTWKKYVLLDETSKLCLITKYFHFVMMFQYRDIIQCFALYIVNEELTKSRKSSPGINKYRTISGCSESKFLSKASFASSLFHPPSRQCRKGSCN